MKAVVFEGVRRLALLEQPEPELRDPHDVLVRLRLSGICGTDRGIFSGKFGARPGVILGHEAVGEVDAVGAAVQHLEPGDRVVVDPTLWCGWCTECLEGRFNFCANKAGAEVGVDRDGTFAPYIVLPARFLYRIPDGMSFERAVWIEPVACVLNNLELARLRPEDTVAIFGGGPIGMIWTLLARRLAAQVVVVEKLASRLEMIRRHVDHVVDAGQGAQDLGAAVRDRLGGRSPRVVVDTVGHLLEAAVELVDRGGRIVLMGFDARATASIRPLELTNRGISILGAGDYNRNLQQAIAVTEGLDLEKLITHRLSLAQHADAFEILERPMPGAEGVMKVVFDVAAGAP